MDGEGARFRNWVLSQGWRANVWVTFNKCTACHQGEDENTIISPKGKYYHWSCFTESARGRRMHRQWVVTRSRHG